MKRWIIGALIAQAILVLALAAVLYFVPIRMEWVSASSAPSAPPTIARTSEDAARDFEPMTDEGWQEFEQRWTKAPEQIRALARQIAEGAAPDPAVLEEIGAEALSRGYPVPALNFTRDGTPVPWLSTLLQEAVWAYNLEATRALLAAGADPNVNNGEVLFIAIEQKTRGAPNFGLFPDYDETLPFLRAYLEAGANPNVQRYGFRDETPLSWAHKNLAAILLLLEFGADPWVRYNGPSGRLSNSMINNLAFGAAANDASEILFRMARSGNLPKGPEEQEDEVFSLLSSVVDDFASGTGPRSRHKAWRLDQLLQVLGPVLDRKDEADAIRNRLTAFDYQTDGGWYLAEDEIHSRPDEPFAVPDKGSEIWGP